MEPEASMAGRCIRGRVLGNVKAREKEKGRILIRATSQRQSLPSTSSPPGPWPKGSRLIGTLNHPRRRPESKRTSRSCPGLRDKFEDVASGLRRVEM